MNIELPPVFRGRDAVAEGWLTPGQLRGGRVVRLLRGVYAPAGTEVTHELLCCAAGLVVPSSAGLSGLSLATILGVPLARTYDPVVTAVPEADHFGPVRGLRVRRVCATEFVTSPWRTWRVVDSSRFCFDLCAGYPLGRAVAHLDAVARMGHLDLAHEAQQLATIHDNDVRHVRAAVALADSRAESLRESELRVLLHQARIPVVPQHTVHDASGRFVARVDLALPELRIAIEYDGLWHASRAQLERDRDRLNRLREAGWTVISVTAELLADPARLVEAVRREIARRVVRA
jgi:very-short-patch-repair endonuclease